MSAAAIPPAILPRVAQLVRMIGSPSDGEALAACRALGRTLQGVGADLHALAEVVERPIAPAPPAGRGQEAPRKRREARPGDVVLDQARALRIAAALSLASARGALTAWEADFVGSILPRLRGFAPRLSARQAEVVERMMRQHGEGRAWA